MRWREHGDVRWLEAELPAARASFTTRRGGVSQGDFEALNLGLLTDDEPERVHRNRTVLTAALGIRPGDVLSGRQVHGTRLLSHSERQERSPWLHGPDGTPADADAHATAEPGLAPLVYVADCLPVALSGPGGVAMLHCGWRGLAGGIVARGVREVQAEAAAIGPGIGPCCYEVGEEVANEFSALGAEVLRGRMLDLPAAAETLLREAGVERVERAGLCTSCEPELFFSHRRDNGRTGRQAGVVVACPT